MKRRDMIKNKFLYLVSFIFICALGFYWYNNNRLMTYYRSQFRIIYWRLNLNSCSEERGRQLEQDLWKLENDMRLDGYDGEIIHRVKMQAMDRAIR